jgi:hypothetical protein
MPFPRADEIGAALSEDFDVWNRHGVHPHLSVHRWGKQQLCFGSEYDGPQSVMAKPVNKLH